MNGKVPIDATYPRMDAGVCPISVIKVDLYDPKTGIVAANEPQLVIEKTPKMTLSEKICYSLTFLIIFGGLVGLISYRICESLILEIEIQNYNKKEILSF